MITVGITGGIGSGKTTVANTWEELGARVVFADNLARKMMQTDPDLKKKLVDTFGPDTYTIDGTLNKPHLIKEAFEKDRVDELNAIVHPAIRLKTQELISEAREDGEKMFAYEAAILLNEGRPDYVDKVVLVTSDKEKRLERVLDRDNVDEQAVLQRMAKQPDFGFLKHLADFVIENNGSLDELKQKSVGLYNKLIGNH